MDFEWDAEKSARNRTRHGIEFDESRESFDDALAIVRFDAEHSDVEQRFIIVRRSKRGRTLVTIFVERGTRIRIISSRRATRREVRDYEEGV